MDSKIMMYQLDYINANGFQASMISIATTKRVLDYDWNNRGINMVAGYVKTVIAAESGNQYGTEIECWPVTMDPTPVPSDAPMNQLTTN